MMFPNRENEFQILAEVFIFRNLINVLPKVMSSPLCFLWVTNQLQKRLCSIYFTCSFCRKVVISIVNFDRFLSSTCSIAVNLRCPTSNSKQTAEKKNSVIYINNNIVMLSFVGYYQKASLPTLSKSGDNV